MKTIIVLMLFLAATSLNAGSAPADPLWEKALAVARANKDWVAGLVITRTEVLRKGEKMGTHEFWQRSSLGSAGEVIKQTVKVLEDGKDVTEKEKKKEKKGKNEAAKVTGNPFDPESQDHLFLSQTNRVRVIAGKDCVGYLFEVRNTNGPTVRGIAWLDKATGVPMELENMTMDPLPDKHLKRLVITTRYEGSAEGEWHVKEMQTDGSVSVMFINADTQSTTTFSEYWRRKPRDF